MSAQLYRVEIARHATLRALAACLDRMPRPLTYGERGDVGADIAGGPPQIDHPDPCSYRRERLPVPLAVELPEGVTHGINYYPPGGAGIGWHTDSRAPGWRIYMGRPLAERPGELLTLYGSHFDEPGLAVAFCVPRAGRFWHAVRAPGERMSLGIRTIGQIGTLAELLSRL